MLGWSTIMLRRKIVVQGEGKSARREQIGCCGIKSIEAWESLVILVISYFS